MKLPITSLLQILLTSVTLFFCSCEKLNVLDFEQDILEEEDNGSSGNSNVRIITKAATGSTLSYPMYVYAFDSQGKCKAEQTLENADEEIHMTLSRDDSYSIVAISADKNIYEVPSSPSFTSAIKLKDGNYSTTAPLQMGIAEITPSSSSSTVHLQLYYAVSSIEMTLQDMPDDCSAVSVNISTPYEGIQLDGKGTGEKAATISLVESSNNTWTTGNIYIFPTQDNSTKFNLSYNSADSEVFSTATYNSTLKSGVPYKITGTFDNNSLNLTGDITSPEWAAEVGINFTFSDSKNPTIDENGDSSSSESDDRIYTVSKIPSAFDILEDHVIAAVSEDTGTSATLLLISLADYSDMTAASNTSNPTSAFGLAEGYLEYDLTGWTIPTEEQAKTLYSAYQNNEGTTTLEEALEKANGDPIVLSDGNDNIRYLCEEATKTFAFYNSRIMDAGATVEKYHLRLVRKVKVKTDFSQ